MAGIKLSQNGNSIKAEAAGPEPLTIGAITLKWTSPEGENLTGYYVGYSTTAVSDSSSATDKANWWSSATSVTYAESGNIKVAGESQSVNVLALDTGQKYYFMVRAYDADGNTASYSNAANITATELVPALSVYSLAAMVLLTSYLMLRRKRRISWGK